MAYLTYDHTCVRWFNVSFFFLAPALPTPIPPNFWAQIEAKVLFGEQTRRRPSLATWEPRKTQ